MYPPLLRTIAVDLYNRPQKYSIRHIGNLLSIGKSTIHRWLTYQSKPKSTLGSGSFIIWDKIIAKFVRENPHSRLKDIQIHLRTNYGKALSLSTICRYLRKLNLSYKRISFQNYTNLASLEAKKRQFEADVSKVPLSSIVSLDESYFYTRMYRAYGYSGVGRKCVVTKRVNSNKYSLLLAVSVNKILAHNIIKGNYNRHNFYEYLNKQLLPTIKGKTIIMDNVAFHKCKEIMKLIQASGNSVLFIPPYSPNYNPVEVVFRMVKSKLASLLDFTRKDIALILYSIHSSSLTNIFEHSLKA